MTTLFYCNVTCFSNPEIYKKAYDLLSEERRKKADAYRIAREKYLCVGAGALFDFALRAYGREGKSEAITYGAHGKPYLSGGLYFNLSHSGEIALCALSCQEVGVDVEETTPHNEALIRRVCSAREYALLNGLGAEERQGEFCKLWTAKESYMKLTGRGLSLPAKQIEVDFNAGTACAINEQRAFITPLRLSGYFLTCCQYQKEEVALQEVAF